MNTYKGVVSKIFIRATLAGAAEVVLIIQDQEQPRFCEYVLPHLSSVNALLKANKYATTDELIGKLVEFNDRGDLWKNTVLQ